MVKLLYQRYLPRDPEDANALNYWVDFLNANEYGLRNSLWAREESVISRFVGRVRNGGLLKVNDSHIGFLPYLPTHGGTGPWRSSSRSTPATLDWPAC